MVLHRVAMCSEIIRKTNKRLKQRVLMRYVKGQKCYSWINWDCKGLDGVQLDLLGLQRTRWGAVGFIRTAEGPSCTLRGNRRDSG
jgi:hypothetical protein